MENARVSGSVRHGECGCHRGRESQSRGDEPRAKQVVVSMLHVLSVSKACLQCDGHGYLRGRENQNRGGELAAVWKD